MLKVLAVLAAAFCCESVLAATPESSGRHLASSFGTIGLVLAYLSRRQEIGGWLLYYYMQLLLSMAMTCVLIPGIAEQIQPDRWENVSSYVWHVLGTVPLLAFGVIEVVFASVLLFRRNEATLRLLRLTQVALVIASVASLGIDITYFDDPGSIFVDSHSLLFAVIWALYFRKSTRVKKVFVEHTWWWSHDGYRAAKLWR